MAIIWTKHATLRNKERQISTNLVEKTINSPDTSFPQKEGRIKYVKDFGKQRVSVITTKTDNGEYLILSAWIDPPNPGTVDFKNESYQNEMKKAGTVKKFWLTLRNQINL